MSFRRCAGYGMGAIVTTLLLLSASAPAAQEAPTAGPTEKKAKSYRYGVGWDEGLALRARLGGGWGVGLRINPDLVDPESEASSQFSGGEGYTCIYSKPSRCLRNSEGESQTTTTGDRRTFSAALMLYHERPLGKWLAGGPYLALGYDRQSRSETSHSESRDEWTEEYPWTPRPNEGEGEWVTDTTGESWQRSAIVELGIRPVFRFHERFTLETRFGLELRFTDWNATRRTHSTWMTGSGDHSGIPVDPPMRVSTDSGTDDSEERSEGSERRFRAVGERLGPGAELRFIVHF